jgi:uncharacterized membrane protein
MPLQISNAWKAPVSTIISAFLGVLITFLPTITEGLNSGHFTFNWQALIVGIITALIGSLTNFLKEQKATIDASSNTTTK